MADDLDDLDALCARIRGLKAWDAPIGPQLATAIAVEALRQRARADGLAGENAELRATLERLVAVIDAWTDDGDDYVDAYTEDLRRALDPQHGEEPGG